MIIIGNGINNSAQNENGMTRKTPPLSMNIFVAHMVTPPLCLFL